MPCQKSSLETLEITKGTQEEHLQTSSSVTGSSNRYGVTSILSLTITPLANP